MQELFLDIHCNLQFVYCLVPESWPVLSAFAFMNLPNHERRCLGRSRRPNQQKIQDWRLQASRAFFGCVGSLHLYCRGIQTVSSGDSLHQLYSYHACQPCFCLDSLQKLGTSHRDRLWVPYDADSEPVTIAVKSTSMWIAVPWTSLIPSPGKSKLWKCHKHLLA